jgi:hypothetical protein
MVEDNLSNLDVTDGRASLVFKQPKTGYSVSISAGREKRYDVYECGRFVASIGARELVEYVRPSDE